MRRFPLQLNPEEWATMVYCMILTFCSFGWRSTVPRWALYAAIYLATAASTVVVAWMAPRARVARSFEIVFTLPILFSMACHVAAWRSKAGDYDGRLIAIDGAIGGAAVHRWAKAIETPVLTWLAQVAWISHYLVAFIPGVSLYRRGDKRRFEEAKLMIVLGFLAVFLGYVLVPSRGPAYYPNHVAAQPTWSRGLLEVKAGITALDPSPYHAFPSGHVLLATIVGVLLVRNRMWARSLLGLPVCAAIVASTLYLRYHYLTDVVAGAALAAVASSAGIWWSRRFYSKTPLPASSPSPIHPGATSGSDEVGGATVIPRTFPPLPPKGPQGAPPSGGAA